MLSWDTVVLSTCKQNNYSMQHSVWICGVNKNLITSHCFQTPIKITFSKIELRTKLFFVKCIFEIILSIKCEFL